MLMSLRTVALVTASLLVGLFAQHPSLVQASLSPQRSADPVVLPGAQLPSLQGIAPARIVAFSYRNGFQQIPVQIDKKLMTDLRHVYADGTSRSLSVLTYADPQTFTGADPSASFDDNDELVFMAADAGDTAPARGDPPHTLPGTGVKLVLSDPLAPGTVGTVYLYQQDGQLNPGAGRSFGTYTFALLSGDYKATYRLSAGPNPERSSVVTPAYTRSFGDRWLDNGLRVTVGGASGAELLDHHKEQFAPGDCTRTEDTFDAGEGAFIANINGPVRAIRAFVGADSGPFTERAHFFYAQREDIVSTLRVHEIPGILDYFDDNTVGASGLMYYDNNNLGGVRIDGSPDAVTAGQVGWQLESGPQGSITMALQTQTDIAGFASTLYYLDSTRPNVRQCTGDSVAMGSAGPWVNQPIPCTDPSILGTKSCPGSVAAHLRTTRTIYYDAPGMGASGAQSHYQTATTPLSVTVAPR